MEPMEYKLANLWTIHVDESSNINKSRARLILTSMDSIITKHALCVSFKASNNEAKYKALLVGLKLSQELGVRYPKVLSNFQLVIEQAQREYEAKLQE